MSTTETPTIEKAQSFPGFCEVPASLVRVMGESRCDLFRAVAWSQTPVLFCAGNLRLTPEQLQELSHGQVVFLYVRAADNDRMQREMRAKIDDIVASEDIPLADRYELVQNIVATDMKRLFHLIRLENCVEEFQKLGDNMSRLVTATPVAPDALLDIARHNTDTFTHMINVSAYCVLLAKSLGVSDEAELKAIGTGGLMHDIGKRFMPRRLLLKSTSFNEEEKRLIHSHPQKGYEELCRFESVSFGQLMMAYQHHERVDGKGYPVRIAGNEMHYWAKICAVIDVFEALTGKRPYRKPEPLGKVLEYMTDAADTHFDKEIVRCWSAVILRKP
jgi:HD-GYP domain-containing protein (c-di-GMP phosphodiesterase class II)